MCYALNIYSDVRQLFLNKTGKINKQIITFLSLKKEGGDGRIGLLYHLMHAIQKR